MQVKEGKVQAAPGLSTGLRISHPVCLRDTISLPRGVIDQTSPQQCSSQQPGPFSPEIRVNLKLKQGGGGGGGGYQDADLVKQVERIYRGCGWLHLVWEGRRMMALIVSMLVYTQPV